MRLLPAVAIALFLLVVPAADAKRGPCIPGGGGGKCQWWDAKVTLVADGDTIKANIAGVGAKQVRFTGINAMELSRYSRTPSQRRGACHGLEATAFIERYIKKAGWKVKLAAQRASSRSGRRLRRSVWVRSGGKLVDLAKLSLAGGHALWMPNDVEDAHNAEYAKLAAQAIAAGRNLYDPTKCGAGPSQDIPLSLVINWDADGGDAKNINGEWVDVRNDGGAPVDLGGWWLRDSALRYTGKTPGYAIPRGTVVAPGQVLRVKVGRGQSRDNVHFWGLRESVFENVERRKATGDGAYLFDPQGDLRASAIYPCLVRCVAPLAGKIDIRVDATHTPETITLINSGGGPLDLGDHVLKLRSRGVLDEYVFGVLLPVGAVLAAGDSWRYRLPHANMLWNNGGVVELRTADNQLVSCADWGDQKC